LLLALFTVALPAAPSFAQEPCSGVTVVVDFGVLASASVESPVAGCASGPANGLDALAQAGFSVTEVATIRGMVCRIDELPDTACGGAPPAQEYWSYWRADSGDTEWTFSMVGGGDAHPAAGDVEGWAFGDGSNPPALNPTEAASSSGASEAEAERGTSFTWLLAVAALAVIGGLVVWRLRRDRRA
jgi:hypothetical protein